MEGDAMVMMEDVNEQNLESARSKMSAICDPLGISKKLLLDGNPAQVLHQVAQDQEAGVMAVGSHGFHGWRAMLGETANSVLHGPPCDVFAIMTRDHTQSPGTHVENILVAVDMTDEAQQAIDRAIAVRDRYEADISALTVVSRTAAPSQAWMQRPQLERFLR